MAADRFHVTRRQLADLFGATLRAVNGWTLTAVETRGRTEYYDLRDVIRMRLQRAAPQTADLANERAALARSQRSKLDLETAELRGELVRAEAVEQRWSVLVAAARAKLLALPSRIAQRHAVPGKTAEMQMAIEAIVHEALNELANDRERAPGSRGTPREGDLGAAAKANGKRVGGRASVHKRGVKRRAREVADSDR